MAASSVRTYGATNSAGPGNEKNHYPVASIRNRAQDSTTGSRWRFNRSTVNLSEPQRSPSIISTGTRTPKLERATSKMSLFNLFSRPKVEKARGHTEVGLAVPMQPQTPPQPAPQIPAPKSSLRQNPSPPAQQTIRARSSQIFRQSMRPTTPSLPEAGSWEPPPLFQAFPQSLKHATVQACIFPPEVLMRTQSQRRQAELLRERMDSARDLSTISENGVDARKLEKSHRRLVSNSVLNPPAPDLVNKIYILVTAGYVLQYAGDGSFNRVPERILKLGKESAAFACDLIPGKHWVLQISSHAHNDGTVDSGPRSTLLSRLRSQNNASRKPAASFLLVLDSAQEMDDWMTAVRKEIDSLGGSKTKEESERASSSLDESSDKNSADSHSHRHLIRRDPSKVTNRVSGGSPHHIQQINSPKVSASSWDTNQGNRTASLIDSSSEHSGRWYSNRLSTEASSVASTPISHHQVQLDPVRGRSRFSFMSATTATSGVLTQNTSREPSPAPQSPLKENMMSVRDSEPLRSAMSLKSFHMNPANNSSCRRRSMQPLPVTSENSPNTVLAPMERQRHSLHSPTSPSVPDLGKQLPAGHLPSSTEPGISVPPSSISVPVATSEAGKEPSHFDNIRCSESEPRDLREDSPLRHNFRNFSVPPRGGTISPPPREPAPLPPVAARRQSILNLPPDSIVDDLHPTTPVVTENRPQRRLSSTPKPYLRPFPIRPQAQHIDGSRSIPRRQSSLAPASAPAPLPLRINVNRSVTAPVTSGISSSAESVHFIQPNRRPTSVQVRSDPVLLPLASRSARAISSTPSFLPGRRMSNVPTSTPRVGMGLQSPPSVDTLRQQALAQHNEYKVTHSRRSLPVLGLPPPAPPPNMALPPLPPTLSAPTPPPSTPLPSLPVTMPAANLHPVVPLPAAPSSLSLSPISHAARTNTISV